MIEGPRGVISCYLSGDGSKATLIGIGTTLTKGGEGWWPIDKGWVDRSRPGAETVMLGCNGVTSTNRNPNSMPDKALIRRSLDQIRAVRIVPPENGPEGVTDVKIFRVGLCAGTGKNCLRVSGAK